jgi:hypothetical protein
VSESEIIKNFLSDLKATEPKPTPTPTMEQLLEATRSLGDRPQLGRVEVGVLALKALTDAYNPGRPGPADPISATYGALAAYGVPVVVPKGDEALEPNGWRLLDTDGHVIAEGTL